MIKRELKQFKLVCDGVSSYPVEVPFTIYSALCDLGRVKRKNTDVENCNIEEARVTAVFDADDAFFNGKYTYLRLSGIDTPARVYLNGSLVGIIDGKRKKYLFDTEGKVTLGENKVEIEFTEPAWNSGVLSGIEFLKFNHAVIDRVCVSQKKEENSVVLNVRLEMVGDAENTRAVATLISGSGQMYYGGFNNGSATVTVRDPLYWWPGSLGIHNVYKLSVNLYGDLEIEDSIELKIGLRTLNIEKNSEGALLEANGIPFVPMGAVYVPEKNFLPAESRRRAAAFVTSAAMANFNTFVIKAGENIPSDEFFDLCDVHGIAVIFEVCDSENSTVDTLARLSHHPSFASVDYIGTKEEAEIFEEKISELVKNLNISVFSSAPEYFGEVSVPCDKTTYAVIETGERNVFSDAMEEHSGHSAKKMAASVSENYLYAYNPSDFAYLTRLSQAENCKKEMLRRRLEFGEVGRAVFSNVSATRLISESSMDPVVGWKALQYKAAKFFAPVVIDTKICGTEVTFMASNANKNAVFGMLEYKIVDSNNLVVYKNSVEVDIAEHSSRTLFTRDFAEQINGHEKDRYIEFIFAEGSHVLARGTSLFTLPKSFKYKKPTIKTEITGADKRFTMTLSADKYVGSLEISFRDVDAVFSENYFDVTTPMPIKLTFTVTSPVETAKTLAEQLQIRSLYDIGRE